MGSDRNFNKVGILGGGQLAMMLAEASKPFNDSTKIWGDSLENSASKVTSHFGHGPLENASNFFESVDIVTLESEFYGKDVLAQFKDKLIPKLDHYLELDTKLKEKVLFKNYGFIPIPYSTDFSKIKEFPVMLKLSSGGYDGYGNIVARSQDELNELLPKLSDKEVFWEPFLAIKREIATQVVSDGEKVIVYPFVQTVQEKSICVEVKLLQEKHPELEEIIINFIKDKKFIGTLAFEFIEVGEILYFNETAPRVHNSGHYTANLCKVGQFENHMRVCSGLEPADVEMLQAFGGMINILSQSANGIEVQNSRYVDYNKSPRAGRKMGHINYWGSSQSEADAVRKEILERL